MTKYRKDLEKQEEYGVVAHERLIEPRVTMKWLLAKPRSISHLPGFLDLNSGYNVLEIAKNSFPGFSRLNR